MNHQLARGLGEQIVEQLRDDLLSGRGAERQRYPMPMDICDEHTRVLETLDKGGVDEAIPALERHIQ